MTNGERAQPDGGTQPAPARAPRSWALLGAIVVFAATRIACYLLPPSNTDVSVYFRYAVSGVDFGLRPYADIKPLEYPPVAYWTICLPRLVMGERFDEPNVPEPEFLRQQSTYGRLFRALMSAGDAASFALFIAIVRRRRPDRVAWAAWGFVLATAPLGYVLLDRLDVGVTLSILAWGYCALRSDDDEGCAWYWSTLGYTALGLGISFKLIPLLVVPFAVWVDALRLARRPRDRRILYGPTMLLITALGPFAYYYGTVGGELGGLFSYHTTRGVEIESTAATVMMAVERRDALRPYFAFGGWNLGGTWEQPLLKLSSYALVGGLLVLGLRALAAPRLDGRFDGAAALRYACATIPVALVFSKVFSVQYLLWALPLLILAGVEMRRERLFRGLVAASVGVAALTTFVYPFHFHDTILVAPYSVQSSPPWTLIEATYLMEEGRYAPQAMPRLTAGPPVPALIARNVLFAACTAVAAYGVLRRRRELFPPHD